ncbi:Isoleucine--tRNA ligase [Vanrija pseudolonga]|uniref:isoleucine--tRNA ligase n=1 Tax=Vanrija pseudolonga TaxID=143232 RepID=A0AAF0Y0C5_9TREE|nr:Isoleucine--tRNA ligase [Vanrija pseudolonga]
MTRLLVAHGLRYGLRAQAFTRAPTCVRYATTAPAPDAAQDKKKYSASLLLPKTDMQLRVKNAPALEAKYRDRTTHELYRAQYDSNQGKVFVFHDGPPYANGNLHMGHALNKILKDMINRYNVIRGRKVHYVPGWDCHGLPIEHKALAALGKSHTALDPISVRTEAKKFALEAIDIQKDEFKQLGVMADWNNDKGVYRTIDHDFELRQLKLFQSMVSKGFISHRLRPNYYSPSSRTALAEAELEYKDLTSTSVYVAFAVEDADASARLQQALSKGRETVPGAKLHLAIWTTTPWSLPGNMGVAVGAELNYVVAVDESKRLLVVAEERLEALQQFLGPLVVVDKLTGEELVGTKYTHFFHPASSSEERPSVFLAEYVTSDSGTGLVHSAPAHGHEDYESFQALGLLKDELRCPIDDDGKFTSEVQAWSGHEDSATLVGLPVQKAGSKAMIELLKSHNLLFAKESIRHRYPVDWRTKEPIIIRATPQWFADVESLKDHAAEAISNINFIPASGRNRLTATVSSRSEWCISRQRSWGVPIPALFSATGEPLLTEESVEHILGVLNEKGVDHWWSGPTEDFIPPSFKGQVFTRGYDTLDVWFDSGTSWTLIEAAHLRPDDEPLADVYLEGSDQHRGWFQSSLLTRLASLEGRQAVAPYRNLITHGFTTDETGAKMSKSQGNGVSPMDIVNGTKSTPARGSDTLRVWAAGVDYTRDASIGPSSIEHASELLRKLRSSMRFIIGNTSRAPPPALADVELSIAERYILHLLNQLEVDVESAYDQFAFNRVVQSVFTFQSTLSAWYFDVVKDSLYCDPVEGARRQAIVATLSHVVQALVKMTAPIAPHLAEEVYEASGSPVKSSVFLDHWSPETEWLNPTAHDEMTALLTVRTELQKLLTSAREAKQLRVGTEATLQIASSGDLSSLLAKNEALLASIFGVSEVRLAPGVDTAEWSYVAPVETSKGSAELTVSASTKSACPRCWLHTATVADALCHRCETVLTTA